MLAVLSLASVLASAGPPDVNALVQRSEQQSIGKSFEGRLKMTVRRAGGDRQLEMKSWTEGRDKALVKILAPAKDRGAGHLRIETSLSQYLPKVERTIKVPPSLMLQSWMGSDFSNDDLVKSSRLTRDYVCTFVGAEKVTGLAVNHVTCAPKPDAPVVWGKLELWIDPVKATLLREEFYTENGNRVKELIGENVRAMDGHTITTKLTMTTLKDRTSTTLEYLDAKFDRPIDAKVFKPAFLEAPL